MANACISLLSSRKNCILPCLRSIHNHYNYKHNYPIYVHYFDDIYDDFKVDVPNCHFIKVPYFTPVNIEEEELFYHRKNRYAQRFGVGRKGYLHMCNFIMNMYKYPFTKLHKHDYIIVFDDDSGLIKDLPFDPVSVMASREDDMGAMITGQRLNNNLPPRNHIETREGLWDFTRDFLHRYHKTPRCVLLKELLVDKNAEQNYHYLPWSDGYVIKTKMYESGLWKRWIHAVNCNGGIYKHRWGDNELMSLFYMIYNPTPIYNLGIVEKGYINQGLFRRIQDMAPGVKDNEK